MTCEIIPVGPLGVNCVILWEQPGQAWLVDPGGDPETLFDFMARRGLQPACILLTHGHCDHIAALDAILEAYPVPVYLAAADAFWTFSAVNTIPGLYPAPPAKPATLAPTSDTLALGGLETRVLPTPGHTPGAVCYYFPAHNLLLSGDTLFAGSMGRTDLPGGNAAALKKSLRLLAALPDATIVIPGHGPTTTIGEEKTANPYLDDALRNP